MPLHRSSYHCPKLALASLLALFLCLLSFSPSMVQAVENNTVFLPFKINASNPSEITKVADQALEHETKAKGLRLLPRNEAEKLVNYTGQWPPSQSALASIAERAKADYVVVGSVTQLGKRVSVDAGIFDAVSSKAFYTAYKEGESLQSLSNMTGEITKELLTYSNRDFTVASIAPKGNNRIDAGAILQKISTKPGDLYDPAKLREDIKSVFGMGYFETVEVNVQDTPTGKAVIFQVQEKPLINEVIISGAAEIKEDDVRDAANITANSILNPVKIKEADEKIKDLYKSKGYYSTQVESSIDTNSDGSAVVHFNITEGEKIVIREIGFTGNEHFSNDELESVIQTATRSWWVSWLTGSGILKMDVLRQDTERLATFYQNHGYLDAKTGEPTVKQEEDGLHVTFPVEEGPRYRLGTVEIQGDLIEDKTKMLSSLKIRDEEYLNRELLREDLARLTDLYAEQGYAYVDINPRIKKSDTGQRIDLLLDVKKGPVVYVNRVEIQGNTRTRDNVIRRDLTLEEGSKFNSKELRSSTQRLNRLDYFESVNITPKPTMREDYLDIVVDVKEKATGQFSVGAGYSSSDNLLFMGEISENNLFGTGNRLALQANISGKSTRYNIKFTDPRIYDSQVSGSAEVYDWEREYDDYTRKTLGTGVRLGHPFFELWRIYYGYSISDTDLSDISDDASVVILRSKDIHITSEVELSLVRDTRDKDFSPTSGSRNSVTVTYAGGPLAGDAEFTKVEGSSSWYFPMVWQTVFHIKGAAGQAFENEDGKLPVYEHFYLGGMNSIRGFDSASISPRDPETGERIGGDKMWYANLGIIFPLVKDMGIDGEIFTDFGNVYDVDEGRDFGTFKKSAGFGVNWASPLGPLRLALGFNLDKQDDEDSSAWDFSLGGTF